MKIVSNEYPPPHFQVTSENLDGAFSIKHCLHMLGEISQSRVNIIKYWHNKNYGCLVKNGTKPDQLTVLLDL